MHHDNMQSPHGRVQRRAVGCLGDIPHHGGRALHTEQREGNVSDVPPKHAELQPRERELDGAVVPYVLKE